MSDDAEVDEVDIKARIRAKSAQIIDSLLDIVEGGHHSASDRIRAAEVLLDRGFGKADAAPPPAANSSLTFNVMPASTTATQPPGGLDD